MWNYIGKGLIVQEHLDLGFINVQCSACKHGRNKKGVQPAQERRKKSALYEFLQRLREGEQYLPKICIYLKKVKEFKFCFTCVLSIFFMPL